jgi:hypothetical protein
VSKTHLRQLVVRASCRVSDTSHRPDYDGATKDKDKNRNSPHLASLAEHRSLRGCRGVVG